MRRRTFSTTAAALGLTAALPRPVRAETGELRFAVMRSGDRIGAHVMRFSRTGDTIEVDIDIQLKVTIAYIPVYTYSHRNVERWSGGRLAGFSSRTDDNGDAFQVDCTRRDDRLHVVTLEGEHDLPGDLMPTTYWHRRFMEAPGWIDTQNGKQTESTVTPMGSEQIVDAGGRIFPADRFHLEGELTLDLWYRGDNWVKLTFEASDESIIEYELETASSLKDPFA